MRTRKLLGAILILAFVLSSCGLVGEKTPSSCENLGTAYGTLQRMAERANAYGDTAGKSFLIRIKSVYNGAAYHATVGVGTDGPLFYRGGVSAAGIDNNFDLALCGAVERLGKKFYPAKLPLERNDEIAAFEKGILRVSQVVSTDQSRVSFTFYVNPHGKLTISLLVLGARPEYWIGNHPTSNYAYFSGSGASPKEAIWDFCETVDRFTYFTSESSLFNICVAPMGGVSLLRKEDASCPEARQMAFGNEKRRIFGGFRFSRSQKHGTLRCMIEMHDRDA